MYRIKQLIIPAHIYYNDCNTFKEISDLKVINTENNNIVKQIYYYNDICEIQLSKFTKALSLDKTTFKLENLKTFSDLLSLNLKNSNCIILKYALNLEQLTLSDIREEIELSSSVLNLNITGCQISNYNIKVNIILKLKKYKLRKIRQQILQTKLCFCYYKPLVSQKIYLLLALKTILSLICTTCTYIVLQNYQVWNIQIYKHLSTNLFHLFQLQQQRMYIFLAATCQILRKYQNVDLQITYSCQISKQYQIIQNKDVQQIQIYLLYEKTLLLAQMQILNSFLFKRTTGCSTQILLNLASYLVQKMKAVKIKLKCNFQNRWKISFKKLGQNIYQNFALQLKQNTLTDFLSIIFTPLVHYMPILI
ncbi:hypothetical protein SS50377_20551 [Spironucleus salmonicida]|uniref:Transmembrane protein n=1 Tax=Spironucleus salmonicida TaxID=348837 RepID=V6LV06_9EUKA|nr:hypothetical protein SS50377_20551 [Spironucleus salmonicida]|eukprot:EST48083.1 Hypothetical protein SS50377_11781 [Spironucleus salmonicida]